jgi:hypothetical protein
VAKIFSGWYGFWGIWGAIAYIWGDATRFNVPLGLFVPFLKWQLNIGWPRAATFPGVIAQGLYFVSFCSATGWFSGLLTAIIYNLLSKYFGFQFRGSLEPETLSDIRV